MTLRITSVPLAPGKSPQSLPAFLEMCLETETLITYEELMTRYGVTEVYVREALMEFKRKHPKGQRLKFLQKSSGVRLFYLEPEGDVPFARLLRWKKALEKYGIRYSTPTGALARLNLLFKLGLIDSTSSTGQVLEKLCKGVFRSPKDLAPDSAERVNMANLFRSVEEKLILAGLIIERIPANNGTPERHYRLTAPEVEEEKDTVTLWLEEHRGALIHTAHSILKDTAEAEDVVADAVNRVRAKLDGTKEIFSKAYLFKAVKNGALNRLRFRNLQARKLSESPEAVTPLRDMDPLKALGAVELRNIIMDALEDCSVDHRQIVELFYFKDMQHTEIAEELGIPLGTVTSRLSRARDQIALSLQENGYFEEDLLD